VAQLRDDDARARHQPLTPDDREHAYHAEISYYEDRARGLWESARDGTDGAVDAFARWEAPLTDDGARTVLARAHGFATWDALAQHVSTLEEGGDPFFLAYRAIEAHDVDGLKAELERSPDLVGAVGTNGDDLLGMATSTCDERLVRALLDAGADPNHGNAHGWTALHQAGYSGLPLLVTMLLRAGARPDVFARGDGGTPLVVALFWGHRDTADLLAEQGIQPRNLRVAAGLGRLDLIDELVSADGTLAPEAGAHRAFYRPHGGFPHWEPSDDPQEILDEGLTWAARSDRLGAIDVLVERGARVNADVHRGTALMWAAGIDRPGAVRRLIDLGADPSGRARFGGPGWGDDLTALHVAAYNGRLDAITALLDAGADPTVKDSLHHGTPRGWAEHAGQREAAKLLAARGG
jgi:ankyrin repeat protein